MVTGAGRCRASLQGGGWISPSVYGRDAAGLPWALAPRLSLPPPLPLQLSGASPHFSCTSLQPSPSSIHLSVYEAVRPPPPSIYKANRLPVQLLSTWSRSGNKQKEVEAVTGDKKYGCISRLTALCCYSLMIFAYEALCPTCIFLLSSFTFSRADGLFINAHSLLTPPSSLSLLILSSIISSLFPPLPLSHLLSFHAPVLPPPSCPHSVCQSTRHFAEPIYAHALSDIFVRNLPGVVSCSFIAAATFTNHRKETLHMTQSLLVPLLLQWV